MIPLTAYLIAIIGALIGGMGALLAYFISSAMNYPELKSWAKTEFREFLKTVLIIAFGMFIIVHFVHVSVGALTGLDSTMDDPAYYSYAKSFLQQQFIDTMTTVKDMITLQAVVAGYSETKIAVGVGFGGEMKPFKGLTLPASTLNTAAEFGVIASFLFILLKIILEFAKQVSFTVIFPLGIVMRAFPMTRKMGSTLIALALTLFFVLPTAILFNQWMYMNFNWADVQYAGYPPQDYAVTGYNLLEVFKGSVIDACGKLFTEDWIDRVYDSLVSIKNSIKTALSGMLGPIGSLLSLIPSFFIDVLAIPIKIMAEAVNIVSTVFDSYALLKDVGAVYINLMLDVISGDWSGVRDFMGASFSYSADVIAYTANKLMFAFLCIFIDWILVISMFVALSDSLGGEKALLGLEKLRKIM